MYRFNAILDTRPEERWPSVVEKTDFRQVLKFFRLLSDEALTEEDKAELVIDLFFENGAPNDPELWDHIEWFISCGSKDEDEETTGKRTLDYNVDHGRIFAAFWQAYGIDLRTVKMHWWTFCELFQGLPDNTRLMQIIDLRGKKPGKNDSEEYKQELRRMQDLYRLDDSCAELESAMDRW